jgi:queuosine precursor transporter
VAASHTDSPALPARARPYKLYDSVLTGFVVVLVASNLIGPAKACRVDLPWIGALTFGAGNVFFPIAYIFGDVLTEVYGYARARRAIWVGFAALAFTSVMSWVVIHLPIDPGVANSGTLQPALVEAFGSTPRIVLGSMVAYWAGDFVNSYILAKLKVRTAGRFLWLRTISSTIVGQAVDSAIMYPIAFLGIWEGRAMLSIMVFNWIFKVLVEVVMTPATYAIVGRLKRIEHEDRFDREIDFSPFRLRDE